MVLYNSWLLVPFLCVVFFLSLPRLQAKTYGVWITIFSGFLFLLLFLQNPFMGSSYSTFTLANHGPFHISFTLDKFSWIISLFCLLTWFFSSLYSISYFREESRERIHRYQLFSMVNLYCMLLIFNADNWVTFFIFFELLLVFSYVLIIHYQKPETYAAGLRYVFFQIIGGLFFLAAIMVQFTLVGSTAFLPGGYPALVQSPFFLIMFWGFVVAFAVKAGLFPVHIWLPEAHPVAPSPASALLSGMVIKAGVVGLLRMVLETFGVANLIGTPSVYILLGIAIITMFWGSAIAIGQKHIKRMLAYSSVSQMGYVTLGAMLLSPIALIGSILHILAHSIVKSLLFMSAGCMIQQTHSSDVTSYAGYGRRSPVVFGAFTIGALSMIGFPLFANFVTKWAFGVGTVEAMQLGYINAWWGSIAIGVLLLSSILNALYYLPILIQGWFHPGPENETESTVSVSPYPTSIPYLVTMISLSLLILFFGLYPDPFIFAARSILTELTPMVSCPALF